MRQFFPCLGVLIFMTPIGGMGAQGVSAPLTEFSARKAESILRDQLPCLGCHVLNGDGGRVGPELTTVRERRSPAYVAAIIADPQSVVPGSMMPRTPMPDATRELITRYLASRPGNAPPTPAVSPVSAKAPSSRTPADGAQLYARWCASCHGATGKGDGPNARHLPVKPTAHADAATESLRPDDSLYDTIAGGGAIMNRSPRMPAFGATLAPDEIRALVGQIRRLCRCQGPRWSRDGARTP